MAATGTTLACITAGVPDHGAPRDDGSQPFVGIVAPDRGTGVPQGWKLPDVGTQILAQGRADLGYATPSVAAGGVPEFDRGR